MAKFGIVKLSVIKQEKRMDPSYFLGPSPEHDDAISRAEKRIKDAHKALKKAKKEKEEAEIRRDRFIDDGVVKDC